MKVLNKLWSNLSRSEFFKSVVVLFSGNLIANIISLISIPIISRVYSDEAFGDYAILISTAAVINGIASLGLSSAIMMPQNENEAKKVFMTSWFTQIVLASIITIIAFILSPILKIFSLPFSYLLSLTLIYIYIIVSGLSSLLSVYVNRLNLNKVLFWNVMINSLSLLFITIPLGILGLGGIGFMIAAILGYTIANIQMIMKVMPFTKEVSLNDIFRIYKEYKDFIFYQFPSNLLTIFTIQIPNQFLSSKFGNAALGNYAMCERALGIPIRLVAGPINTIYFRHSTQYINKGNDLSSFTFKLISRVLILAFIPLLLVLTYAESLFSFILGQSWAEVGKIASILIVPYILMFCTTCISYCLVVLNRQKNNLYLSIFQFIIIVGSLYLGYEIFEDFTKTIMLFSIANSIFHLVTLLYTFHYLGSHLKKFIFFITIYSLAIYIVYFLITTITA